MPAPDGKAEVIANKGQDLPAFYGGDQTPGSGGIMFVFAGIGKAVPFVIITVFAVGQHPDEPVEIIAVFLYNDTTGQDDPFAGGDRSHPGQGRPVHAFCQDFGPHAEAGAEHLGKNDQFRVSGDGKDLILQGPEIGGFVFPFQVGLDGRYSQCRHINVKIVINRKPGACAEGVLGGDAGMEGGWSGRGG